MLCRHVRQLSSFLNQIHEHGKMPIEKQTVYNDYEKKRQFHDKLRRMQKSHLIRLFEDNGDIKYIKLDITGDLLRVILNDVIRLNDGT